MKRSHELNMTQGSILKSIIAFAVPLMLSSILQHLFNAADIIVVSRWSGSTAMASVGSTSSLTNLVVNFFIGMSIGVTVLVSKKYGAGDIDGIKRAVHTSLLLSIIIGFSACVLGQILCKPLLVLIDTPEGEVLAGAVLYMRIIFFGTPATVIYNYCAAVLRSIGDSKRPLYIIGLCGAVNFVLNLIFVIGLGMSVDGVALATVISKYLSVILVLIVLKDKNSKCYFEFKKLRVYKEEFKTILKIGAPAGLQNTFTSLANTVIQSAVNGFGTAAIVGNTAAANIDNFAIPIKTAFRQATVTAVGQNYGAKNEKRMIKALKAATLCMVVGCLMFGLLTVVFSKQLLGIYITDSPEAIRYGTIRIILTGVPYFICGISDIIAGYLRGIGYSSLATANSFIGLFVVRVLYVMFIFPIFGTFEMLFLGTPVTWVVVSVLGVISILRVRKKAMQKMMED